MAYIGYHSYKSSDSVSILLQSAILSCDYGGYNFGALLVGYTGWSPTFTLENTGSFPVAVGGVALLGADPSEFSFETVTGSVDCWGTTLAPGSSCSVAAAFSPTSAGIKYASLTIFHDAPDSPLVINLEGTGIASVPTAVFSPVSWDFGDQPVGTSAFQGVGLSNYGVGNLDITSITLTGTIAGDFSIDTSNCPASLSTNTNCSIDVTFHPLSEGPKTAAISVVTNAAGSPHTVPLSGAGVAQPGLIPSPGSLNFGDHVIGWPSPPQSFTLTNNSGATLTISSVTLSGMNAAEFSLTHNCAVLPPGASCTITVVFTPSDAGAKTATVVIASDATGSPHSVPLLGTGVAAEMTLAPTSVTFYPQLMNTTSGAQTVTLTNTGDATLTIMSLTLGGANAADFTRTDNCGASVNGGASCVITLTFRPTATGSRAASVSISSNASGSPHSVELAGEGTDFNIGAASGSSMSATVSPGGSASFTLSLAPTNGYTGTVAMSCTTSSAEVGCSVPASVTMNGAPTNVTVTVTTTARAYVPFRNLPPEMFPTNGPSVALAWAGLLLFLGTMLRWQVAQRGQMRPRLRPAVALVVLVLCAQLWIGCSGGENPPPPPRTYAITVNASSAGVVRTVGLTVTVP